MTGKVGWRRVRPMAVLCWAAVVPAAAWAVVRTLGLERGLLVQLLAFTPYAAAAALVPLAAALLTRRWYAAGVAGLAVLALAFAVLPRALPMAPDPGDGPALTVLTANLRAGAGEPTVLVDLVRDRDVDVLALQEFSPAAAASLHAAGLASELPHQQAYPVIGTSGSAIYSRFPLRDGGVRDNAGGFRQAYATVDLPGGGSVIVESVHPCAPHARSSLSCWWVDLAGQPPATPDGPIRILAGDFNATLDHVALRRLIDTGYRDAAASVGAGLLPTWQPFRRALFPPVTIDRVLVDRRVGVREVGVHRLPGSDHRTVLAELTLPDRA